MWLARVGAGPSAEEAGGFVVARCHAAPLRYRRAMTAEPMMPNTTKNPIAGNKPTSQRARCRSSPPRRFGTEPR